MRMLIFLVLAAAVPAMPDGPGDRAVPELVDPWLHVTIVLETDGAARSTFAFDDAERVPDSLRVLAESSEGATIEEREAGGTTLSFPRRSLERVPELLDHLPADRTGVAVLVRVPPDVEGADLWEFQARLSALRIRQVRIQSDDPPSLFLIP